MRDQVAVARGDGELTTLCLQALSQYLRVKVVTQILNLR